MVKEDNFKKMEEKNELPIKIKKDSVLLMERKKQIILYGPPGTGKTFSTKNLALAIIKNGS